MTRRLPWLIACGALAWACLDFDAKYSAEVARLLDGGLADAGAPDSGGGTGTDAAVDDAGPAGDAAVPLPPCDASLCEFGYWTSSTLSGLTGLVASSVTEVVAVGGVELAAPISGRDYRDFIAVPASDGGFKLTELEPSSWNFSGKASGRPDNFWAINYGAVFHVVNRTPTLVSSSDCVGGSPGYWDSVARLSDTSVLVAGQPFIVCRFMDDGNGTETLLANLNLVDSFNYGLRFYGLAVTPSGATYLSGSDGYLRTVDGGIVSPGFEASYNSYGMNDVQGTSDTNVWAVGELGTVARLQSDGGFEAVFDAGMDLRVVGVVSESDVWAAGQGATLWHYDGAWSRHQVPHLVPLSRVKAIAVGRDYLHVAGWADNNVPSAFLLSFRRGP